MANLYAICRTDGGLEVKRVPLAQELQQKLEGVFVGQANAFLNDVNDEIEFGSGWKPDENEIFAMKIPADAQPVVDAINGDILALEMLDSKNIARESIKALATSVGPAGNKRIIIQLFTAQQVLSRRMIFGLRGDTFTEIEEPLFTIDNYVHAIVENDKLKFKSYYHIKRVFEFKDIYQEATNQQIESLCTHDSIVVENLEQLKKDADQTVRKLVHAVIETKVLDQYPVADIAKAAEIVGIIIPLKGDKINFPCDRKSAKILLRFLDDGIYLAPLTLKKYMANSKIGMPAN